MANWYGSSPSNYFRVKDAIAFRKDMEQYEVEVWSKENDSQMFALGANTENGEWPGYNTQTDEDFYFADKVWPHLAEGEVLVLQTIGAEKLRYLTGYAQAISHTGKVVEVSINDIYDVAKRTFKVDQITEAAN